jgi:hypothetical protein
MPVPDPPPIPAQQSNAGRLSYFFAFGVAVFIASGDYGVAVAFGLMMVACIATAIHKHVPDRELDDRTLQRAAETQDRYGDL